MARVEDVRNLAECIYALYDEKNDEVTVKAESADVAAVAHAWFVHARRTGRAVLLLAESGYEHEAAPLRRSLIEHALGLRWLADSGTAAVLSLLAAQRQSFIKLQSSMGDDNWSVTSEDFARVLEGDIGNSSDNYLLHMKQRVDRYGYPSLMVAWLIETTLSHSTAFTADALLATNDDGWVLLADPKNQSVDSCLLVAAMLLMASEAFNSFLADSPWSSPISDLAARLEGLRRT